MNYMVFSAPNEDETFWHNGITIENVPSHEDAIIERMKLAAPGSLRGDYAFMVAGPDSEKGTPTLRKIRVVAMNFAIHPDDDERT